MPQHYELNIRDYWRIIRKRRNIIILTTVLISVLTFAITLIQRPKSVYEAAASVRIERATSLTGMFVEVFSVSSGDSLATQTIIIKSFPVLERVAKEMGMIPKDAAPEQIYAAEKYVKALSDLQNQIKTQQEGNTNIINVTVSSNEPKAAQKIANLVVEKYREESIFTRNKQIFEARKFIEEQLKIVEAKLKDAEETLNNYKKKKDVISITDEQKAALDRYSELETEREKLDKNINEIERYLKHSAAQPAVLDKTKPPSKPQSEGHAKEDNQKTMAFLEKWRERWENKDLDAYMSCYSTSFNSRGMDWNAWKKYKGSLNKINSPRKVSIKEIETTKKSNNVIVASFIQHYIGENLNETGLKKLYLKERGGDIKITGEEWIPMPKDAAKPPVRTAETGNVSEKPIAKPESVEIKTKEQESPSLVRLFTDVDADISKLNAKLSELYLERNNLLISLLPAHPQVKELDAKIANVRAEIKIQMESKRSALQKKREIVSAEMDKFKSRMSLMPFTALELSRIEREVKINQELFSLLKTKYQEALIKEAEKVEEVSIVKRALEPASIKNPPKTFLNTVLGLLIGLIFGLVFAFIFESFDTSIGTIEDVEEFLGTSVIGVIPNIDTGDVNAFLEENYKAATKMETRIYQTLISHFMPKSIASESYRSLRTNVIFMTTEKNLRTVMITSSSPNEGKTITAINLAITMAQVGRRVLIIDADFRNPALHSYFGLEKEPGLSDAILGNITWQESVRNITDIMLGKIKVEDITVTPGMDNISIITSGSSLTQPSEFLNSNKIVKIMEETAQNYDLIIFDVPPVLPVADAVILGNKVDGVFMVYEVGKVARSALRRAKSVMENVGAKVMGVILNKLTAETSPDFYHGTYYYYSGKDEDTAKTGEASITDRLIAFTRGQKSSGEK